MRMLEGDQRVACRDRVEKLIATGKTRAALLSIKAMLEVELDQHDKAARTVSVFVEKYPDNPVALAQHAMLVAMDDDKKAVDAVGPLQKALGICQGSVRPEVREALHLLGRALLIDGNIVAARQHLRLAALSTNSESEENEALALLFRLDASPSIPLLIKEDRPLLKCPEGVPWGEEFDRAMTMASFGAWQSAVDGLTQLAKQTPNERSLQFNIAWLHGWLGDTAQMVKGLHEHAHNESIPLDDAVDAEAAAQLLDTDIGDDRVDIMNVTYVVPDSDSLMERLISHDQASQINQGTYEPEDSDAPPPRAYFMVLDRALPTSSDQMSLEEIPWVLGELVLYGKETDREARAEYLISAADDLEAKKEKLRALAGDLLGDEQSSDIVEEVPLASEALGVRLQFPSDTTPDMREELTAKARQQMTLSRLPNVPTKVLDGKSPAQVSGDPAYRVRLLAMLLRYELASSQQLVDTDFNELRSHLGLPLHETVDPWTVDVAELPIVRLSQLDVVKLSDAQLVSAYRRAAIHQFPSAIRHIGSELLARGNLADQIDQESVFGMLARCVCSSGDALDYLARARGAATDKGQSPARWKIEELSVRLKRGEPQEIEPLLMDIQKKHFDEPGVMQSVMKLLQSVGAVPSDDEPLTSPSPTAIGDQAQENEAGELWTPDSEKPQGGDKPTLWVPGMD